MHIWEKVTLYLFLGILFVSCASSKKVVYLQDVDVNKRIKAECEYKMVLLCHVTTWNQQYLLIPL